MTDTLRGFKKSDVEVKMRPEAAINRELATLIRREQPRGWKGKSEILSRETIYFEQGKRYLQPALLAAVRFNGDDGQKTALYYVVPAMENTPEKIVREKPEGAPTTVKPNVRGTGIRPIMLRTPYPYQANPVLIGMYVVKEDHECWVSSANGFWSSLAATNGLFWLPKKKKAQYFWDYVWLWYADGGVSDHSMVYPGQVHLALVEGHGAPWLITCYKNYGEVIHIKKIKGLGANMGYNEKTAYVIWHSCDVVPAPGDPHAGDFTSGSVFTPWWSLFKGMRGTYGYRTTMYICDGVMSSYGARIGLGMPMLSSWLHCTDHSVFGHQNGFEYGSAVIVSGHEQDTLYTNSPLPNPTSLTIWWNHA